MYFINTNKSGQRPAEKRGPGCFACGWKDFFGLIFCYFFIKEKVMGLSGQERHQDAKLNAKLSTCDGSKFVYCPPVFKYI